MTKILTPFGEKPVICFLIDKPNWAYDFAAKALARTLSDEFQFKLVYVCQNPDLSKIEFDLLHVFFWGETYHEKFNIPSCKVIKEISSHRWANEDFYGKISPQEMADKYLINAHHFTATSKRLFDTFKGIRDVALCPNGYDLNTFKKSKLNTGPKLQVGWAGNIKDPCKGVTDILRPATQDAFNLQIAGGTLSPQGMSKFYNKLDVICIASTAEGEPLTLIEALACGNFPVAVDVGIVPELIIHKETGLIVERTVASFRAALYWCQQNLEFVRKAGARNASLIAQTRSWNIVAESWRLVFRNAYAKLPPATMEFRERNLGIQLGKWPERSKQACSWINSLKLSAQSSIYDLGCGHQTVRTYLSTTLNYVPFDYLKRADNVQVLDLQTNMPPGQCACACMLGVIEYMYDPTSLLNWAATNSNYLVISYNDFTNPQRRAVQNWNSTFSIDALKAEIEKKGKILKESIIGNNEIMWLVRYPAKRLALLSAAENGDNAGDDLIVNAIQRITTGTFTKFPLLQTLTDPQIEEINQQDAVIICGTNLYQTQFNCALTPDIIRKIKVPILPLGIGASAAVGHRIKMDKLGVKAVRMIHEQCNLGSVRDPASLEFVRYIGVKNARLTGCPVLFHSMRTPNFTLEEKPIALSIRHRLLHIDESWGSVQDQMLVDICTEFSPKLIAQSPYDIEKGKLLADRYKLPFLMDPDWRCTAMLDVVKSCSRTVGLRLHLGMLFLSYGKPAILFATDTRTTEFCKMIGIPYYTFNNYSASELFKLLKAPQTNQADIRQNWEALASQMRELLKANNIATNL